MPTESTPHRPQTPCTEIAPTQSSTPTRSKKSTDSTTTTPATVPIVAAAQGDTNAHGAVIATRPASMPLHSIDGSCFRPLTSSAIIAPIAPVMLASIVFTTMKLMRRSVPASVEPGLNPNQPNARMNVPSTTIGMLWPGIALGLPCLSYLPMRAPTTIAPASPISPPIPCTTPDPAKSTAPWPRPQFRPACASQPPPHTQLAYRQ